MKESIVRSRRGGQTLIIALIVLGVLLIVGFVFLGIVNRNIIQQTTHRQRTLSGELAEAGVRYCHEQMLTSELGADWKGVPTVASNAKDPDADVLTSSGPDGLGPYTRVTFANGRALVRVRYTPTDSSLFQTNPQGSVAKPGKARSYLIIESIGRPGSTDPTVNGKAGPKDQSKLIAFCPIGIIESARYITDKYREMRPADIGSPALPVIYKEASTDPSTPVTAPQQLGTFTSLYNFYNRTSGSLGSFSGSYPAMGSIYSNAPLRVNGDLTINVSEDLGDFLRTADVLTGADTDAKLTVNRTKWNGSAYSTSTVVYGNSGTVPLDSRDSGFDTFDGMVRDGMSGMDDRGFPRGISRKEPPSILTVDPATGASRYLHMTRDSGVLNASGNSGRFGHGRNIYVNNASDLQISSDEQGRIDSGSARSLEYDWLNPNNGQQKSGWVGPFYVPRGAFLQLQLDGFTITRDPKGPAGENTWCAPDGVDSGRSSIRYRLGEGTDSHLHILNTLNVPSGSTIDGALSKTDFETGPRFDGVLYFEGNVRVRGIIPTDVQLSVVSNGTIYVEGSITKGTIDESGTRLTRPSRAALGLLARQYVCLNTTAFFGPDASESLEEVNGVPNAVGYAPVRLRQPDGSIRLDGEMLLDPDSGTATNPSSWKPFAMEYTEEGNTTTSNTLGQALILTHTMDDGPGAATFLSLDINKGLGDYSPGLTVPYSSDRAFQTYLFDETTDNLAAATNYFGASYVTPGYDSSKSTGEVPLYGLGGQGWQRYSKFESTTFQILNGSTSTTYPLTSPTPVSSFAFHDPDSHGTYRFLIDRTNVFTLGATSYGGTSSNDYLLARAGLMPHDIRIEASMYAEEGSFFVIPGPWFNPNPGDSRLAYTDDASRKDNYGSNPAAPFYQEPIDVRVNIVGAVSENMPPPMSVQVEWLKKWGWIPMKIGASGRKIPSQHVPATSSSTDLYVPNLTVTYDPVLATGKSNGFDTSTLSQVLRSDDYGRALPPIPRLPVSPSLAYFGQVNP